MTMDERLKIEKILNDIDFSQGREKAVWEKIVSLRSDDSTLSSEELDCAGGGLSQDTEHYGNLEDLWKK